MLAPDDTSGLFAVMIVGEIFTLNTLDVVLDHTDIYNFAAKL